MFCVERKIGTSGNVVLVRLSKEKDSPNGLSFFIEQQIGSRFSNQDKPHVYLVHMLPMGRDGVAVHYTPNSKTPSLWEGAGRIRPNAGNSFPISSDYCRWIDLIITL